MRGNRSIFVGLFALLVAIGLLGANGYFWWLANSHGTRPFVQASQKNAAPGPILKDRDPSAPIEPEDAWAPEADPFDVFHPYDSAVRFFPHHTEPMEIAQADGSTVPPALADKPSPPPPLLLPDVAEPIESAPANNDWLSRVIQEELPSVSAEECRIWAQELQGFEPEVVRDILRMKKSVMASPPSRKRARPEALPNWPPVSEPDLPPDFGLVPPPVDELSADRADVSNRLGPSLAALELARDVILNNLANAHTAGFKRSRVVLSPLPSQTIAKANPDQNHALGEAPEAAVGLGVELASTPLDMSQGPLKKTHQPLDVAIEGPGFFQIQGEAETFYTRCGRFALDDKGRLCLLSGPFLRPLKPTVTIPQEATSLIFKDNGEVAGHLPGQEAEHVFGRLELARFQNPSALSQHTGQLFAISKTSGRPQTGTPQSQGFGSLRQGMLEKSNVLPEEELEEFHLIQSHCQLLKHLAGTADHHSPPGPIARRPSPTQRASVKWTPQLPPPLESLKNQGRDLIEEYLQSERMTTIKRTLGLQTDREENPDPDQWFKKYFMSEKARSIERNLGRD